MTTQEILTAVLWVMISQLSDRHCDPASVKFKLSSCYGGRSSPPKWAAFDRSGGWLRHVGLFLLQQSIVPRHDGEKLINCSSFNY